MQVKVIDYPGHYRLRQGVEKYIHRAGCIIFVVNANASETEFRQAAEYVSNDEPSADLLSYLYGLFTNPFINDLEIPFLIALNKSEMLTAKNETTIRKILETELYI